MKWISSAFLCFALVACDQPSSKEQRTKQVQREVASAGGEAKILDESRILFARCSTQDWSHPFVTLENRCFTGLTAVTNLGDVFYYHPDHFEIRIHNSHRDTYFIALLNPDQSEPDRFERVAGNVGFIEPDGATNRSQPVGSPTNRASVAAGSSR
jgi:hypothetical protein